MKRDKRNKVERLLAEIAKLKKEYYQLVKVEPKMHMLNVRRTANWKRK